MMGGRKVIGVDPGTGLFAIEAEKKEDPPTFGQLYVGPGKTGHVRMVPYDPEKDGELDQAGGGQMSPAQVMANLDQG